MEILDRKGYVGRITYEYKNDLGQVTQSKTLIKRGVKSGMGYLTDKAFVSNVKSTIAHLLKRDSIRILKVERMDVATCVLATTILEADDL
jgi:hypothetical protein